MAEPTPRGIQATLFDYFQDTEYFDLQAAEELVLDHQNRDVNRESVRARIYEGIDKGLFERVGKGLYMVTRDNQDGSQTSCLLINGDGRDLSMFPDNSLDAIITDHPWADVKSLKGGNRNFAQYELFEYTEEDFRSKHRILKPGHFLVEFLPEENANNYQYLYRVKEMARKAGMEYYAKVNWVKGAFVANTGRKSKNVEDVCFFTKGRARELRPDAKKDKAEPGVTHYMSGAHGMLPTSFNVNPPKNKIHQAEKPVELLEQILNYVTLPGETALDQFAGSGVLGEAALNTGRNSILIEKDADTFRKLTERLQLLGSIQALTPAAEALVSIGKDALIAQDAFQRTGDRTIIYDFVKTHEIFPSVLFDGERDLERGNNLSAEQQDVIARAFCAIEDIDLCSDDLDLHKPEEPVKKSLECSSRGDRRFSALFAKVKINGREQSIEEWYQGAKRTADGKKAGKGKPYDHIVCPFTGDKLPPPDAAYLYRGLWITYLTKNPDLVEYASQFDEFTDSFKDPTARDRQLAAYEADPMDETSAFFYSYPELLSAADVIGAYVTDREQYVAVVKASHWYQNMASKKKAPLAEQIRSAASRTPDHSASTFEPSYQPDR